MITQRWQTRNVMEVLTDCTRGHRKIPKSDYLTSGKTLVVDQSSSTVPYFTDEETDLNDAPYIVFGDHTREIKFVTQSFLPGADGVKILKPSKDVVDPKYTFHYLKSNPVTNLGYSRHFKLFREIEIPLPPLEEQRRITVLLDRISSLEKSTTIALRHYHEMGRAVLQRMHEKHSSELLACTLEDLLERIESGKSPSCSTNPATHQNQAGVLKLSAITSGDFLEKENKEYLGPRELMSAKRIHCGDLLMTRKNTPELVGAVAFVSSEPAPALYFPDLMFRLIPDQEQVRSDYMALLLMSEPWRSQVRSLAGGSAKSMSNISQRKLKALSIDILPYPLQCETMEVVGKMESQQAQIRRRLELLHELHSSLSARAFNGKL